MQHSQPPKRVRMQIRGLIQGVGFRPHVYRLALAGQLSGWVRNESDGVCIEAQGSESQLSLFRVQLVTALPELARIDSLVEEWIAIDQSPGAFQILASQTKAGPTSLVPPDLAPCSDCLREMRDPANRRFRYPFINCIQCGPRFTIMRSLPYDRPQTTMQAFAMCEDCQAEYTDPSNRRYHAQPIACSVCGPQIWFTQGKGEQCDCAGEQALTAFATAIAQGLTLAIKGIGGFHLVCDARNLSAVTRLRDRKQRPDKPLAIMLPDIQHVRMVAHCSDVEQALLESRERPIVLLNKLTNSAWPLAGGLAPDNPRLGIMLPYSPLHYLLMLENPALVMTSGNLSDEPIVWDNAQAVERLGPLVDGFLFHDRPIHAVCDDSVVSVTAGGIVVPIRRSRGYAPLPVKLSDAELASSVLAVGGELKSTFCLANSRYAFQSQHIGDMENLETVEALQRNLDTLQSMLAIQPDVVVADSHPSYLSTQWAREYTHAQNLPLLQVQHHHAHLAALACEHELSPTDPLLGICFDGTGYGTDGHIWGGELLLMQGTSFQRLAHLAPMPLPGGDASIRKPYRTALAYLKHIGSAWSHTLESVRACSESELKVLNQQLDRQLNCPMNTSMGRLFDAVAALLGVRQTVTYEAQAAMELESLATEALGSINNLAGPAYHFQWQAGSAMADIAPILRSVLNDLAGRVLHSHIALKFHLAVVDLIEQWAIAFQSLSTGQRIGLTGGVFQNGLLLDLTVNRIKACGLTPLMHRVVPCNDAGISLGQVWVARQSNFS